ncbi:MAG: outer membrane beta-barrel protein [Flavobacteriaceae bacterium]|nr:porin family protein [Flavobacteriaceae bacterium]
MKRILLLLVFIVFTTKSFSQDSKISLEINYPLPDHSFVRESYHGIIDVGVDYTFTNLNFLTIGAAVNGVILNKKIKENNGFEDFRITSYVIQPKIVTELDLESVPRFHPSVGIGYSLLIFDASNGYDGLDASDTTKSGFNLNIGLAYNLSERFFVQIQYDFILLKYTVEDSDIKFNTTDNLNLLKIGFGYRL